MFSDVMTAFPLKSGRVHEAYGAGAATFAVISAALSDGAVLWIREGWESEALHPPGVSEFMSVSQLLMARSGSQTDSLAVAEEALRDGSVDLVIVETSRPLDLREGRRLQLSAKAGDTTGLCLIPEGMGSNAAETRWHILPVFEKEQNVSTLMMWDLKKNKSGSIGSWYVRWASQTRRVNVVPPPPCRAGSQDAAG